MTDRYPKPAKVGGTLIRRAVSLLRRSGLVLPITSHIHIATSGGADSIALAHLILKYGRRLAVSPKNLALLHINHGWRGKESDADELFVRHFAEHWGVPCRVFRLTPAQRRSGESWEDAARAERKRIFEELIREQHGEGWILTAHHADDLAETSLWRLFTGTATTHGAGIAVRYGRELRPFLQNRKKELCAYLQEEGQDWREDRTNHEGRFLRSKMRQDLMPIIEKLFPKAIDHLIAAALEAQFRQEHSMSPTIPDSSASGDPQPAATQAPLILLGASGLRARRDHFRLFERWESSRSVKAETHLPGGWTLRCEKRHGKERWILEKK